jgi:hypothetical protein
MLVNQLKERDRTKAEHDGAAKIYFLQETELGPDRLPPLKVALDQAGYAMYVTKCHVTTNNQRCHQFVFTEAYRADCMAASTCLVASAQW